MIAGLFTCKYRAWSGEISLANKCHPVMTPSLIAPCAGSGIRIMLALRSVWGRSFASWPQDRLSADNGERRIYCMIRRNYKTKIWQDENTPRRKYDKTKTQDENTRRKYKTKLKASLQWEKFLCRKLVWSCERRLTPNALRFKYGRSWQWADGRSGR